MNGGNVIFNFKGDTKDVEEKSSKLSSKIQSLASGVLKGATVVGGAFVGITAKAVEMGGELEQQLGGTEAVFGKFSDKAQELSKTAFKNMGTSANEYMATINKMGSLMQGSGISQEKSLDLASKAMQRASDVASIMGIDISSAMESIAGAAKGNFTMMDNLGVAMNETTLNAYALSKGIEKTTNEMTNAEKIELAMQMFLDKSSYAMGNYAKENDTFAGSLSTLKASITNLLSGIGNLDDTIEAFENFGTILVSKIKDTAPKVIEGLVGLLQNGVIPMLPSLIQSMLPTIINGIIDLTTGLVQVSGEIISVLLGMFPEITKSILTALPEIFEEIAIIVPDLLPQVFYALVDSIPGIIESLPGLAKAGLLMVQRILISGAMPDIPGKVKQIWKAITTYFTNFFPSASFIRVGDQLIKGLWQGIHDKIGWITNKIQGFSQSVIKAIKGIFGIHSPSREFAYIGRMNVLGLEKGFEDEEDTLQSSFNSLFDLSPNLYGNSSLNMSPNVNVVVNNNMKQDPLGQMVNEMKTFSNGAKNDYNYGGGI